MKVCYRPIRAKSLGNGKFELWNTRYFTDTSDILVSYEILENGFVIKRTDRPDVVFEGEISDIKVLRDNYIVEVFVNKGEEVYTAVLC